MNYQDFKNNIITQLTSQCSKEFKIQIHEIVKNNGMTLDGLTIMEPGQTIIPTIYLNPYFSEYQKGTLSIDEILSHILITHNTYSKKTPVEALSFTDYTSIKSKLMLKLINYPKNHNLLKEIPHIPYLDLAICFLCRMETSDGQFGSILIRNEHLAMWNISEQELYNVAMENSMKHLPATLSNLEQYVFPITNREEHPFLNLMERELPPLNSGIYILSNSLNMFGASTIVYENLLRKLSEAFDSSLIILPSSVHEVLIIPSKDCSELSHYSQMVRNVNQNEVSKEEILSDHAYYYDSIVNALTMGDFAMS